MEWLNLISVKHEIVHAEKGGEFHIPDTLFHADGYCESSKTIFEFHGDYWHGNPSVFNSEDVNNSTKTTFGELYEKTLERQKMIESLGYRVVVMWESDWKKFKKAVARIQQTFKHGLNT
jgi:G:T-mismatch repair DNA endonuclease (very short patch repair protein)